MPSSSQSRSLRGGPPGGTANRPLYAIDFTAVACGKRIANTKRRVRWRFGLANPDALAAGETGTACRGEEHDVTIVWSVTSGKRLILADGQEVHYSNSRSAVLDFSWTMRGNHVLKVVAHATAPMSAEPGFRQYDFFVDGRSFFSFPKVYRLGLSGNKTVSRDMRSVPLAEGREAMAARSMAQSSGRRRSADRHGSGGNIASLEAPHNPDEEEAYLREAIKASLESESKRKSGEKSKSPEKPKLSTEATDLLIDFMDDFNSTGNTLPPAPTPTAAGNEWALAPAPVQANNQWAAQAAPAPPAAAWAAPPPAAPVAAPGGWNQPPPPATPAAAQPPPAAPAYASPFQPGASFAAPTPAPTPVAAVPDPFSTSAPPAFAAAPAPVDPMAAYGQPPPPAPAATVAQAAVPPQPPAPFPASPQQQQPPPAAEQPAPAPVANGASNNVVLTMGSLATDGLLAGSNAESSDPAGGGGPTASADKALQNLMGSIDAFGITGAAAKPPAAANNPFDSNNILSNATLGEIQSSKGGGERKSVMNAPPAPGPGAMVMASSQGGNWGSAVGGGYGAPQQQQAPPQYSMSGGYGQPPPQMGGSMMGQPPQMGGSMTGQPPQMGGSMMGQPPMQQMGGSMMGQQPPMQPQGYGAPPYGQQQPPMQQNQWGAPSY